MGARHIMNDGIGYPRPSRFDLDPPMRRCYPAVMPVDSPGESNIRGTPDDRVGTGAVILAAGRSQRMGSNKLIADIAGKAVVAHVADAIAHAGLPPPIVILGNDPDAVRAALAGRNVRFVTAADHQEGMARSLAAGIAATPADWMAALICLGDMPLLSPDLVRALAAKADAGSILVPTFAGRRGNPVLWGRDHFPRLQLLEGDVGAKALFAEYHAHVEEIAWCDNSIAIDVDLPDMLTAVRGAMMGG